MMKNFEKWWGEPLDPTLGDEPEFYAQEGWRAALEWVIKKGEEGQWVNEVSRFIEEELGEEDEDS